MILGIDTSCYTTSLALFGEDGLLADQRRLLAVKEGGLGLRQSEGFFQHVQQLPLLLTALYQGFDPATIAAVAVSSQPRPLPGSYMPVFAAGKSFAVALAASLRVPWFATSHQEGHLAAGLWSAGISSDLPHLAVHLSGGTSELLRVEKPQLGGFAVRIVGGSDLPAGQFIDRVGVALGLPFPAGPALEALAEQCAQPSFRLKATVKGAELSFSGPESAAQRAIRQGVAGAQVAAAVFAVIGDSLAQAITYALAAEDLPFALVAGGVAANRSLRARLEAAAPPGKQIFFAAPHYAGDNAVGVAILGREKALANFRVRE